MTLNNLRLLNFRNHRNFKTDFKKTNVVLGPNASGKTNLLEAIYLLSTTKSFRTGQNQNLISFGESFSKIEGRAEEGERQSVLEIFLNLDPKIVQEPRFKKEARIDGKKKYLISLLGNFLTVLFTPETLNMILGPPPLRRRSMDLLLTQVSKKYTQNLIEFLKILKQRNRLLSKIKEGKAQAALLDLWDEGFLKTSALLREQRKAFLDSLNNFLPKDLRLFYLPSPKEDLEGALKRQREREIDLGFTLIGPQKDDFLFFRNKKPLSDFGSRGEVREGAIFFKLAEWEFIKQKTGFLPTLLLDDIFSELDKKRRGNLKDFLFKGQTILTTTSLSFLNPEIINRAKVIELK